MLTKRGNISLWISQNGLGLCARKDGEGFAETMSPGKVPRKV